MNTQHTPAPDKSKANSAMAMIKAVYEDGSAEINGRSYVFHKTTHYKRRKVFAFYSKVGQQMKQGDMSFLDSEHFEQIEGIINDMVSYEGSLLSKLKDHWDSYPEDYLTFVPVALGAISYPFLQGNVLS